MLALPDMELSKTDLSSAILHPHLTEVLIA